MTSIGTKFLIAIGGLAVAFSALVLCQTWWSTHAHLEQEISRRGELALEFDLAIREYVAETVRPEMARRVGEDEFVPEVMSTSFVARSVFEKVRRKYPDYVLKFSSDNPRSPQNVASPAEMEVLEYFRENPEAKRWVGRIEVDGGQYVAHFSPRRMKKSCLGCHGRPEDAPKSLLERYGPEGGFHHSVGDVIATDTVAIPTDKMRAALAWQTTRELGTMAVWLALVFGSILVVFRRIVGRRLAAITEHFRQAAEQDEDRPLAPVPVSGRDEIAVLASSFNALAAKLQALHVSLGEQVQERTAELEAEIAEHKKTEEELQRRMTELERFNRLSVGRETRMVELKREINALLRQLGREEKYAPPPHPPEPAAPQSAAWSGK